MYQKLFQALVHSEQDTQQFANQLKSTINFGESVGLIGELGAGKTTLVRHFVQLFEQSFGQGDLVSSPTYVLQHIYNIGEEKTGHVKTIEHWDLYRLTQLPEDLEMSASKQSLRLIEWADKFSELHCDYLVKIDLLENASRQMQLLKYAAC